MGAEFQMTFPAAATSQKRSLQSFPQTALQAAVSFWFGVAVIGRLMRTR
jgi:hypothetical protein